jgi:3-oxoacyl-[acyl-carrier protein] reductase
MDETILVVGAGGEIGRALVRSLSAKYRLALWISPNINADTFRSDLGVSSDNFVLSVDLSEMTAINEAFVETRKWCRSIYGLVTCSGLARGAHSLMTETVILRDSWNINFLAPIIISQLVAKMMIKRKKGRIIHLSSIQGVIAQPGNLAYGSSKAALSHASKILAAELGPFGIHVNSVCPTVIESAMGDTMDSAAQDRLLGLSSRGKLEIAEVVSVIEFLIEPESSAINGQTIRLDGGMPF